MSEEQFIPKEDLEVEILDVVPLSQSRNWGLDVCQIDNAWKVTEGDGIKVAVLDTGIADHDDLVGAWSHDVAFNFSSDGDYIDRKSGHGLHCAGIIGARNNDFGVVGVAPKCTIIPIKVLNDTGGGNFMSIVEGIKKAMELDVDIISMSLGSSSTPPPSLEFAVKNAAKQGIIMVAAAGNDGRGVNYPAKYDEVIAVAAMDENKNPAPFTSRGEEVDSLAPGVDIYSTFLNNGYAKMSGTSQACPFIAGLCALLLAHSRNNPNVPQINNTADMLRALDEVSFCVNETPDGMKWGFGPPLLYNVDWNKV